MNKSPDNQLRLLPAVNDVLEHPGVHPLIAEQGRHRVVDWVRVELDDTRRRLSAGESQGDRSAILDDVVERIEVRAAKAERSRIGPVINATGVILHTSLGRAPLSQDALSAVAGLGGAGNVEVDVETNDRRYRGFQLQAAWHSLTGCEDSLVVNNNAAATLLTLQSLCAGKEVVISRGQMIEIGGSFRLPDIFELSGAKLREVGTTNRTRLSDYARAIGPETAAVMRVHPSNYRVIGFAATPPIGELAQLARDHNLTVIDDIGSGSLVDVSNYGLPYEPTFIDSLQNGADVVLGSGDKLLGGPQAGIVLGTHELIGRVRRHPLARAVRVDKLTLAALSATLDVYLRGAAEGEIPVLAMLAAPVSRLLERAAEIRSQLQEGGSLSIELREDTAPVGGGSLPGAELATAVLALKHKSLSADQLAQQLRVGSIRVFSRIQHDEVFIDLRSVLPADDSKIALSLRLLAEQ